MALTARFDSSDHARYRHVALVNIIGYDEAMTTAPEGSTSDRSDKRTLRINTAVEMFWAGSTMTEIGRHFGVSPEMIRLDLLSVGITSQSKRTKRIEDVERLAAEGLTVQEIAEQVGISKDKVRHIARSNSIQITPPTFLYTTHGEHECYVRGCRCDLCTQMNSQRVAKFKESLIGREIPDHAHGTSFGYNTWKCRCPKCMGWYAERDKPESERTNKPTVVRQPWTDGDDRSVMDYSKGCGAVGSRTGKVCSKREGAQGCLAEAGHHSDEPLAGCSMKHSLKMADGWHVQK